MIRRQELCILGVGVALIGGWMAYLFIPVSWPVFLLAVGITSFAVALLVQARWAILAAPAAVWLGAMGTAVIDGAAHSRLSDPVWPAQMLELAAILVVIAVVPSAFCVLIGMLVGTWASEEILSSVGATKAWYPGEASASVCGVGEALARSVRGMRYEGQMAGLGSPLRRAGLKAR